MSGNFILFGILAPFLSAFLLVAAIFPTTLRIAFLKNIVDNPNRRKLQKTPIPVLGGVAVYWGIVIGAGVTSVFFNSYALFTCVVALTVMMYVGLVDDIGDLSPRVRLIIETLVILFVIKMDHTSINHFHGLFGIGYFPPYLSLPLCVVAGAGIINSINLIDGVDGLSSGYCLMACIMFGIVFSFSKDGTMVVMAALATGAILPFFFHNVFGKKTKMFIGDAGTLMMGMLMSIFCMRTIDDTSKVAAEFPDLGVVAFCLAVLAIPVFDTLRVMTVRILKGGSPFQPDKTHLHHLFIEVGFSHVGTAIMEIVLNVLIVGIWFASYLLGASVTWQFVIVVVLGFLNTTGFYYTVKRLNRKHMAYRLLIVLAKTSRIEAGRFFLTVRKIVDRI